MLAKGLDMNRPTNRQLHDAKARLTKAQAELALAERRKAALETELAAKRTAGEAGMLAAMRGGLTTADATMRRALEADARKVVTK